MAPKCLLNKDSDLFVRKFAIIYGNRPKNQLLGAISNGSQQDFLLGDTSNGPQWYFLLGTSLMASKFWKPPCFFQPL